MPLMMPFVEAWDSWLEEMQNVWFSVLMYLFEAGV
jgi:hypothetical protein